MLQVSQPCNFTCRHGVAVVIVLGRASISFVVCCIVRSKGLKPML